MNKPKVTGIWRGEVEGFRYHLDLVQTVHAVHGTLHVGGFERAGQIAGVNFYPLVSFSGMFLRDGAAFHGQFQDRDTITGTLKVRTNAVQVTFRRDNEAQPA
jgi:hypothetical protein